MVGVNTICRIYSAIHDNSERMPLKQQFSRSTFLADRLRESCFDARSTRPSTELQSVKAGNFEPSRVAIFYRNFLEAST